MRRALASLILGLSLVVASMAWSGFVMLHTVLDPGRSERLADQMLDNAVLRGMFVDAVADSIEAAIPPGVDVPRSEVEAAADLALEDPRAEMLVRDGIVRVHQNALEGVDEPVVLDPTALGAAARDAVVARRPELAPVLPAVSPAPIALPETGLGFLGTVRDFLERAVTTAALVAVAGTLLALLISRNRPGVLRRVALWAFAASAFWLILAFGVPWLAERLAPSSAAVFAAVVEVFLASMIPPALFLAGGGVALVVASLIWDLLQRSAGADRGGRGALPDDDALRRPEAQPQRPPQWQPQPQPQPQPQWQPQPVSAPARAPQPQPSPATPTGSADPTTWVPVQRPAQDPWDVTRPEPSSTPAAGPVDDPWAVTQPRSRPRPTHSPRWVEGVGYVED